MNILVLSWRDPKHPLAGGAEQVMHEHMKGWIKAGNTVTFLSSQMKGLPEKENLDGVKIIRKGYQYLGVQIAAFIWYSFSDHDDFDLIVDQFHGLPFFTPLYVRKPKLAVIQETTRSVWLLNPLIFPLNMIIGLIGYIFEFLVFIPYKWTTFMTGSASAVEEVVKMGIPRKNIKVVNHGVILSIPKKIIKNKVPTITYLGRLSKDKGIEHAIITFDILDKQGKFEFVVIGKPETEEYGREILRIVSKLKLRNKITFFNRRRGSWVFVSDKDKFTQISKSMLMVNPSSREGWGLVNIEANSVGVPVIAYNSPGLVDSVVNGKSGIICQDNTPEDMAKQIKLLIKNSTKYKKLVNGSIAWSKNFSWQKSRLNSLTLINNVVSLETR